MGGTVSKLDKELVEEYVELTYFTKNEINKLYNKFAGLDDRITPENFDQVRLDESQLKQLPEFRQNPFLHRLIEVFSTSDALEDGDRSLSFEDYLDMVNVLSEKAPFNLKAHYAFRVFDFDGDDFIGPTDLKWIINTTARNDKQRLDKDELKHLTNAILEEADLDKDNKLGESEFEHMLKKSPDFMESFQVRII